MTYAPFSLLLYGRRIVGHVSVSGLVLNPYVFFCYCRNRRNGLIGKQMFCVNVMQWKMFFTGPVGKHHAAMNKAFLMVNELKNG